MSTRVASRSGAVKQLGIFLDDLFHVLRKPKIWCPGYKLDKFDLALTEKSVPLDSFSVNSTAVAPFTNYNDRRARTPLACAEQQW